MVALEILALSVQVRILAPQPILNEYFMEKYILVEGPLLEEFMQYPEFYEKCFLMESGCIGFVPQSMYNIVMYGRTD